MFPKVFLYLVPLLFCFSSIAETNLPDYEKALIAYNNGDENEAFVLLKNALQEQDGNIPVKLLLAQVYFDAANFAAAEDQLTEALLLGADPNLVLPLLGSVLVIEAQPSKFYVYEEYASRLKDYSKFEWILFRAQIKNIDGDRVAAETELNKALQMYPTDPRALNSLAELYLGNRQIDRALDLANQSLVLSPKNEKTLYLLGLIAQVQKQHQSAYDYFEQGLKIDPQDPLILRGIAIESLELGKMEQAKDYLLRITEQTGQDPTALLLQGYLNIATGESVAGNAQLEQLLIDLKTESDGSYDADSLLFIQGAAAFAQGQNEQAQNYLQQYIKRNGKNPAALKLLSDVYVRQGFPGKVPELLTFNYETTIQDPQLLRQLFDSYLRIERVRSADPILNDFVKLYPDHEHTPILQAQMLRAKSEPIAALERLESVQNPNTLVLREYWHLKANLEIQLNSYTNAAASISYIESKESPNQDLYLLKAALATKMQQFELAEGFYKAIFEINPDNFSARFNYVILLQSEELWDKAVTELELLLLQEPENENALYLMARNNAESGQRLKAFDWLDRLFTHNYEHRRGRELQFRLFVQQQAWPEALESIKVLNQRYIHQNEYLQQYVQVLLQLEQSEDAVSALELLSSLNNDDALALADIARLQIQAGFPEMALSSMNRALELQPQQSELAILRARLLFEIGRESELSEQMDQLLVNYPNNTQLKLLQGDMALSGDDNEAAMAFWKDAVIIEADEPDAYLRIYQLGQQGNEGAWGLLESLLVDNQNLPWKTRLLADMYLQQNKLEQSLEAYEYLLQKWPNLKNDASILNNLANLYALNDLNKAIETALKAVQINAKSAANVDTLGWLLTQNQQYSQALPHLRNAFALDSGNHEIRYHLAYTLFKLERFTEAKRELEAIIRETPDSQIASQVNELLGQLNAQPVKN
ncbi:PEP-CTERM system TPR-repeat protein PrsT [Alginatibacterium sediminis]|uniref:PEP-CTERM system TPR-repeat protein PrsT n=1 Tax=Alginatibacterium sediminis TaxID=2164068 RepID=A0A420ED63_9ALTE|nr:XrtA/PEP-CTERM system TPR-repeat protein PrsT [Alginatibacterium sediminis]RKF18594.1 PEP-CTERM system TPR-repeat protein PrsT [Alginatibacterium sediminis]